MSRRLWSNREIRELRSMVADGSPTYEIGKQLGRSIMSVRMRCFRMRKELKRKMGRVPDVYKRSTLMTYLYHELTLKRIAEIIKKSPESVRQMAKRLVKDGLLRVIESRNRRFNRYIPTSKWTWSNDEAPQRIRESVLRVREQDRYEAVERTRKIDDEWAVSERESTSGDRGVA